MEAKEVFDELKTILVTRLKFDPRQAVDLTLETTMPKGVDGSIGLDSLDFIELAIASGSCAIRPITLIETEGFRCQIAAEVPAGITGSGRRSRADRIALAAAREALDDAGIARAERADAALIVGAVGGGMMETEAWYWQRTRAGAAPMPPALTSCFPSSHADVVGSALGLGGP